jgi:rhodanese-related sulfurtransferase
VSVPEITVDELDTRLAAGATLIDVRQPEEYVAGHVAEARLIPLAKVPDHVGELTGEVLVICRSGARSYAAAEFLREQEVDAINVAGGTMAWIDSGRDVVTGAT